MPILTPANDTTIPRKYSARTVEHKLSNKTALQEQLGWPQDTKRPTICIPTGLTEILGGEIFMNILPGLLELPVSLLILGRGSKKYGEALQATINAGHHSIAILGDDDDHTRLMLAASDMSLFLTQADDILVEQQRSLAYGAVPISPAVEGLEDYNPVQETGNAFVMATMSPWQAFGSIVRALETFKFPYDWRTIQRHGMED